MSDLQPPVEVLSIQFDEHSVIVVFDDPQRSGPVVSVVPQYHLNRHHFAAEIQEVLEAIYDLIDAAELAQTSPPPQAKRARRRADDDS